MTGFHYWPLAAVLGFACSFTASAQSKYGSQANQTWHWAVHNVDGYLDLVRNINPAPRSYKFREGGMTVPPSFGCKPKSGRITIQEAASDMMREKVAASMLQNELDPSVTFLPQHPAQKIAQEAMEFCFTQTTGWMFRLTIDADEPYLDTFRRTGNFSFSHGYGPIVVADGSTKSNENIGKFIDACRK